jgi:isoquinoline 1-oxidoreductase alpha subunit
MLMACAAMLKKNANPSDAAIDSAVKNICVCGTYQRMRTAVHRAAGN